VETGLREVEPRQHPEIGKSGKPRECAAPISDVVASGYTE
jgi:hypothetical protein